MQEKSKIEFAPVIKTLTGDGDQELKKQAEILGTKIGQLAEGVDGLLKERGGLGGLTDKNAPEYAVQTLTLKKAAETLSDFMLDYSEVKKVAGDTAIIDAEKFMMTLGETRKAIEGDMNNLSNLCNRGVDVLAQRLEKSTEGGDTAQARTDYKNITQLIGQVSAEGMELNPDVISKVTRAREKYFMVLINERVRDLNRCKKFIVELESGEKGLEQRELEGEKFTAKIQLSLLRFDLREMGKKQIEISPETVNEIRKLEQYFNEYFDKKSDK